MLQSRDSPRAAPGEEDEAGEVKAGQRWAEARPGNELKGEKTYLYQGRKEWHVERGRQQFGVWG